MMRRYWDLQILGGDFDTRNEHCLAIGTCTDQTLLLQLLHSCCSCCNNQTLFNLPQRPHLAAVSLKLALCRLRTLRLSHSLYRSP